MPLMDLNDMLKHAYRHRYAVGSFGIDDTLFMAGVLQAAEETRAPVVLNLIATHFAEDELESFIPLVMQAAHTATVPVAINVDHLSDGALAQRVMSMGCNGIMIDHSSLRFSENVGRTAECVKLAHQCGVTVEGELGHVPGEPVDGEGGDEQILTSAGEVKAYVERTGIDCLAVSVGNVHGHAKGSKMDLARLVRIHQAVDIPLVLHGGTGLTMEQYRKAIDNGVAKINYYTGLADAISKRIKANLAADHRAVYRDLMHGVTENVRAEAVRCIKSWRSDGRAAEVSAQCRAVGEVEYVATLAVGNTASGKPGIEPVLQEAQRSLASIPGVARVSIGASRTHAGRYCVIVTLVNETAARHFLESQRHRQVTSKLALSYATDWSDGLYVEMD